MKHESARSCLGACLVSLTLAWVGCTGDPVSPLAPSAHVPQEIGSDGDAAPLSDDGEPALKASAPVPMEPVNGAEVEGFTPVLIASNATGTFVDASFEHEFELYRVVSGNLHATDVGKGTSLNNASTFYSVAAPLDVDASYAWRVRALLDAADGPWSQHASFRTAAARLGVPQPIEPIDGTTVGTRPRFTVRNGTVEGSVTTVFIEIEVASDDGFASNVITARTPALEGGETNLRSARALTPEAVYYWRVRAVASVSRSAEVVSAWSNQESFRTALETHAITGSWPPPPPGGRPPNMLHVVQRVADEHPEKLEASWDSTNQRWRGEYTEFLDLVIDALRAIDRRWAYNCIRGECNRISSDAAAYYRGAGSESEAQNSTDVAIIDFLGGRPDGSTPRPAWTDVTEETRHNNTIGRWRYPRPGR